MTASLKYRFLIFTSLLFFALSTQNFFAQGGTRIALVPLWGSPREIAAQFSYVVDKYVRQDGTFTPFTVSLTNLPSEVPAGGYPPFVCPTPLITEGAPFSMTGEIVYDSQTQTYNLRLYLWEVRTARLIYSDMLSAKNRAECEAAMPTLLQWLFSWVGNLTSIGGGRVLTRPRPQITLPVNPPATSQAESTPAEEPYPEAPKLREALNQNLLYVGLRAGASVKVYSRSVPLPFVENEIVHYNNFIAAVQAAYYFAPSWAVQAEIAMTSDYAPFTGLEKMANGLTRYSTAPMTSYSLMIPVAAKGTIWYDIFSASVLGGVYLVIPLGPMHNELLGGSFNYKLNTPIGVTAGIALGAKAGIGNIIVDIRWCSDLSETVKETGELLYQRNMLSFSMGYEIGLFQRKR